MTLAVLTSVGCQRKIRPTATGPLSPAQLAQLWVEPSGKISLRMDGSYAFTVALQASRRGNDPDGRRYTIMVRATDMAGNSDAKLAIVTVPRN